MMRALLILLIACEAIIILLFATSLFVILATRAYMYNDIANVPDAQAIVIPGAAVTPEGALSPIFQDRVDTAIALYEAKKASKILVSGDNSTLSYNEVNPVRNYLLLKGIPDKDIFLDHAGFDTYSTMYRARDIFGVTSMIIATQSFHLSRSVFIARTLGMTAYGMNADVGSILQKNYIREIFADPKALFDLIINRQPKYLGDKIPITGDGRDSL